MKEYLVNLVYTRYRKELEDRIVEEYYSFIPNDAREPAIDFLANARPILERFFTIQAYHLQKRALKDTKNAQFYEGMLMHIHSLLSAIQRGRLNRVERVAEDKEEDPVEKVDSFINKFKEYNEKKSKEK